MRRSDWHVTGIQSVNRRSQGRRRGPRGPWRDAASREPARQAPHSNKAESVCLIEMPSVSRALKISKISKKEKKDLAF